jgi:transposase, IS5 family
MTSHQQGVGLVGGLKRCESTIAGAVKLELGRSELEYSAKKTCARRDRFLPETEAVAEWGLPAAAIAPYYRRAEGRVPRPMSLERLLGMAVAEQCFGLVGEGVEDALCDNQVIRRFVGVDRARDAVPDAITLFNFRRLLEERKPTERIFEAIKAPLACKKLLLREGSIVDATIIAGPTSTKNRDHTRDPDMHQTKKGKQGYIRMKTHIGVDMESWSVHSVIGTAAHVADVTQAHRPVHGEEKRKTPLPLLSYPGVEKRSENARSCAKWRVAMRRGQRRALPETEWGLTEQIEAFNARIRSKVEHRFHALKNLLGHRKTRYRGLKKNTAQLYNLFGLVNLFLARRRLMTLDARGAS